jgi:HAE1 family hydrophobic/amphiphilic exporter-1
VLTLYITPVIYFYLDKIDSALAGRRRRPAPAMPELGVPAAAGTPAE